MKKLIIGLMLSAMLCASVFAQNVRGDPDAENWDISALDTAADVDYLTPAEKDVILEMNKARADPKKYAELYIKPMLSYKWGGPYGANAYLIDEKNSLYMMTYEGKSSIQSCINDMSNRKSLPLLIPSKGLYLAAKDHANDTGSKGITGHTGSDKSTSPQRISRYGKWDGRCGENISYGFNGGREIVLQLLIDDGVSDRGHRHNIFNSDFKYTGVAIGSHSNKTFLCVIDYAKVYIEK